MERLSKRIELGANLAIIIVAVLLAGVLVKNYFLANGQGETDPFNYHQLKNSRISLPDVDWQGNGQTLVLAVSNTCRFCTDSAPFYQQLAKSQTRTRLVAVLPQTVEEGKRYFADLGVTVDEVKQGSLSSIGVTGTPTLILVNDDGIVVDSWVGRLAPEQEAEVLSKAR